MVSTEGGLIRVRLMRYGSDGMSLVDAGEGFALTRHAALGLYAGLTQALSQKTAVAEVLKLRQEGGH